MFAPRTPPTADALTFEEAYGPHGAEYERPVTLYLSGKADESLAKFDQARWDKIQAAVQTDLFSTPIQHFLVEGYFTEGMDQIMAHMTMIEASLGMLGDRGKVPSGNAKMPPGKRLEARIAALLQDPSMRICSNCTASSSMAVLYRQGAERREEQGAQSRPKGCRSMVEAAAGPAAKSNREDFLWSLG